VRFVIEERIFARRTGRPFGGLPILLLEKPPDSSWNSKVLVKGVLAILALDFVA
jgi:hypothetical protein